MRRMIPGVRCDRMSPGAGRSWSGLGANQADKSTSKLWTSRPCLANRTKRPLRLKWRSARASGDKVVETRDTFAGQLWDHHELTRKGKKPQDVFFLIHQGVMYSVLVTQPIRDQRLIAAAKSGFRLIARSSAVSP